MASYVTDGSEVSTGVRRMNWGCGKNIASGWINSDIVPHPSVDICCDILKGLPLKSDSIDYISSQHALPELKIWDQVPAATELLRVLKPNGVLRLSLPDFNKFLAAYQSGNRYFFAIHVWDTIGGNFITHALWHNITHTLFTPEFIEEILVKAGLSAVNHLEYGRTSSQFLEIVELDNRPEESLYVEAFK